MAVVVWPAKIQGSGCAKGLGWGSEGLDRGRRILAGLIRSRSRFFSFSFPYVFWRRGGRTNGIV